MAYRYGVVFNAAGVPSAKCSGNMLKGKPGFRFDRMYRALCIAQAPINHTKFGSEEKDEKLSNYDFVAGVGDGPCGLWR